MRVNHSGNAPVQGGDVSGAKQSGRGSAVHASKGNEKSSDAREIEKSAHSGANTEISAKSRDFAKAKAVATEAPDLREDKIADLKKRISEGSYKIDTGSIADRMVDDHLRMSGAS